MLCFVFVLLVTRYRRKAKDKRNGRKPRDWSVIRPRLTHLDIVR